MLKVNHATCRLDTIEDLLELKFSPKTKLKINSQNFERVKLQQQRKQW